MIKSHLFAYKLTFSNLFVSGADQLISFNFWAIDLKVVAHNAFWFLPAKYNRCFTRKFDRT